MARPFITRPNRPAFRTDRWRAPRSSAISSGGVVRGSLIQPHQVGARAGGDCAPLPIGEGLMRDARGVCATAPARRRGSPAASIRPRDHPLRSAGTPRRRSLQRGARGHRPVRAERQPRARLVEAAHPVLLVGRARRRAAAPSARPSADPAAPTAVACSRSRRARRTARCRRRRRAARARSRAAGRAGRCVATTCSMASSACRAAASPIAWMWICKPSSSTARAASARSSHTCMPWLCSEPQYGASSAPVSFSMTPSAKNFTVLRGQQRRAELLDAATRIGELRELGVEMARVGVQPEVEPHAQRVLAGRVEVGVDVGGLHPGVLHPGHAARQVVVGGRAERADPHLRVACGHALVAPGRPRPTPATCPAPSRPRGAGSRRAAGRACRR